jgi:hypothetical protein
LRERQQNCSERRCGLLAGASRELNVGQTREACLGIENAQARDDRALSKRRNATPASAAAYNVCQALARVDDLPGEFAVLERRERCAAAVSAFTAKELCGPVPLRPR